MVYMSHNPMRMAEHAEYSIYIYHRPENQLEGQGDWEMRHTLKDYKQALTEARRLFSSNNFTKVEIKQRTADPVTRAKTEQTMKVLEHGGRKRLWTSAMAALGFACTAFLSAVFVAAFF